MFVGLFFDRKVNYYRSLTTYQVYDGIKPVVALASNFFFGGGGGRGGQEKNLGGGRVKMLAKGSKNCHFYNEVIKFGLLTCPQCH